MDVHSIDTPLGMLAVQVTGSGTPAVLWHSLFVDNRSWDRMLPALAEQRRLILITAAGHGSSGDPGRRYTVDECAAAAATVLDRLGITEAVDWVGNALGGHVGMRFAARWPERCRSLIAFGTPTAALSAKERARTHLLLGVYRLFGPARPVLQGTTKALLSPTTRAGDPEAVELVHDCLTRASRIGLRNAVISVSLHREDLTELLPRISAPTLIVTGSDHTGFSADEARAAARLLPRGSVAVVEDAAYLLPLEAPHACTQLVQDHWAQHAARSPSV